MTAWFLSQRASNLIEGYHDTPTPQSNTPYTKNRAWEWSDEKPPEIPKWAITSDNKEVNQSINQFFPFIGSVTLLGLNAWLATEYILYWLPVSILEFFYIYIYFLYIYISIISPYDCIRGAHTKEDRLTHAHHAVSNNKQNTHRIIGLFPFHVPGHLRSRYLRYSNMPYQWLILNVGLTSLVSISGRSVPFTFRWY